MKELRLEYQKETGTQIGNTIDQDQIAEIRWTGDVEDAPELEITGWVEVKEYIEWLEEKLLDDEALFILMNKILNGKNDKAQEHIHGSDE